MEDAESRIDAVVLAVQAGRFDEAVPELEALSAAFAVDPDVDGGLRFMLGFNWTWAAKESTAGRAALARLRDEQARRLLEGSEHDVTGWSRSPCAFGAIVDMNETLGDRRATRDLFVRLLAQHPALVARQGWRALPALVDAGDFALAERYLNDPLSRLASLNADATRFALWPAQGAPRLATELHLLVDGLRLTARVLEGLGRPDEARRLADVVLGGLDDHAVRDLAQSEWREPGTIMRSIADWEEARFQAREAAPPCNDGGIGII